MNIFQQVIQKFIESGASPQTIVLFLLLPLVITAIAAARHIVGFRGLGIFIPTVIALVFVKTGILLGIAIFLVIFLVATFARTILRYLKIQYLPRMALVLWFVTLGVLAAVFLFPSFGWEFGADAIFPLLILTLLTENLIEVQIDKSLGEAISLTLETILVALVGYVIFSLAILQRFALLYPELFIFAPALLDILLGRFTGLRLLEYRRFRQLLGK